MALRTLGPATGTVKWLRPDGAGNPRLMITVVTAKGSASEVYTVESHGPAGWTLSYADLDAVPMVFAEHHVWVDPLRGDWCCDCPDATNRPERRHACKHSLGLRAALKSLPF